MLHGRLSLMLGARFIPLTPSHHQCEGRPPAFQAGRAKRATNAAVASAACLEGGPGPVTPSTASSGLQEIQIEKLVPQPHDAVAFGLTTRNDAPIKSSTKSTSEPARNGTEAGSTSTTAPSRAITRSSSALSWSTSNLYWKPEQPPPSTEMRSMAPSPSVLRISPMRRAARSLTVMAVVMTCSPGRRTQLIWYEASDIVKCVIPWNQMDKD